MKFPSLLLSLALAAPTAFVPHSRGQAEVIDLSELIQLSLQRDFQVRITELSSEISRENARAAGGYWDPSVRAQVTDGARNASNQSPIYFNDDEGRTIEASIEANLPTGGRLAIGANGTKFEDDAGDVFGSNASISLTQPLLQDFGAATSKSRIRVAQRSYQQSRHVFEQEVMSTITRAISLYNQVALAKDSLRVAEQSRELARKLVSDNQRRADLGAIESRGVELAETRLAQREAIVVSQRRIYLDSLNELKRLVSNEALGLVSWNVEVGAMPEPVEWNGILETDFDFALENRPDYLNALLEIEKAELQARASGSLNLPQLDFIARYSRTGYGDGYSNSFDTLSNAEDDVFVGLVFSRPILNTSAKANLAADRIRLDQADLLKQQLQQTIAIQLDNAMRRIQAEAQSRRLTRQGREFAVRSLEAEERKLKLGQSTTFVVLQLQEDLAGAQIRELEAIANYNIAIARYEQVKGITLVSHAVEL